MWAICHDQNIATSQFGALQSRMSWTSVTAFEELYSHSLSLGFLWVLWFLSNTQNHIRWTGGVTFAPCYERVCECVFIWCPMMDSYTIQCVFSPHALWSLWCRLWIHRYIEQNEIITKDEWMKKCSTAWKCICVTQSHLKRTAWYSSKNKKNVSKKHTLSVINIKKQVVS